MTVATLELPAGAPADASLAVPQRIPAPLPVRESLTVAELATLYAVAFAGRDQSRLHYLTRWEELIGERRIEEIDADLVDDCLQRFATTRGRRFLGRDRATGEARWKQLGLPSPATLNRLRSSLSALLRFGKKRRLTPKGWTNPVLEVEALREPRGRTRFLSETERDRLLAASKASACGKLHLLVLTALVTGARKGELLSLRFGDLELEAASAYVRRGKNDEPRVLPLTPIVVRMIRALGEKPDDMLLFSSPRDPDRVLNFDTAWRTAMRLAGLKNFRFHDLRHSCASALAQSGASLLEIADVLGHRDLGMTKRYSHLTIDSKRRLINEQFAELGAK